MTAKTPNWKEAIAQLQKVPGAWIGSIAALPAWVEGASGPERPWVAIWVDPERGKLSMSAPMARADMSFDVLLETMLARHQAALLRGTRPERLLLVDKEAATYLGRALAGVDTEVQTIEAADEITRIINALGRQISPELGKVPSITSAPGMTLDRLRSFAEAATEFYRAAPWERFGPEELVRVESPGVPRELGWFSVMGSGGEQFGLAFFARRSQFEGLQNGKSPKQMVGKGLIWSATLEDPQAIPFEELDFYDTHVLPTPKDGVYPFACGVSADGERIERPSAEWLAVIEGLLRATARSTGKQIDQGRWTMTVPTTDGNVEFVLSLAAPKQPRPIIGAPSARKPIDEAQDIIYDAWESPAQTRLELARRALSISPDCADAYVILAEAEPDPEHALEVYQKAVEAGERALGPKAFKEFRGHFWGLLETRPYMRARERLANALRELGRYREAADHYEQMLELNPGDNQGIRYVAVPTLYAADDLKGAQQWLDQYQEPSAFMTYMQALVTFRQSGDSDTARAQLANAVRFNPHALKYLLDRSKLPRRVPEFYSPGSKEEAILAAIDAAELWEQTPGALDWLKNHAPAGGRTAARKPKTSAPAKRKPKQK